MRWRQFLLTSLLALGLIHPSHAQTLGSPHYTSVAVDGQISAGDVAEAPNLHLLTTTPDVPFNTIYANNNAGTTYTYGAVFPVEGTSQAIRIGIAQPYAGIWAIASATLYYSDSYSGFVQNGTPLPGTPINGADGTNKTILPTANSVWLQCTLTNGSPTIICPSTATIPTATGTVYAIGPSGMPIQPTVTVSNGTTATMSASGSSNFTGTTGTYTIQFANLATGCKIYWDNWGAQVDTINTTGVNRSFTLRGPAANTNTSVFYPSTIAWSDLTPCVPIARADGGSAYIAFVYITNAPATTNFARGSIAGAWSISANTGFAGDTSKGFNTNFGQTQLGGRYWYVIRPWNNGGADYADNPTGSGWTYNATTLPAFAMQYISDAPGKEVAQVGDSLSAAPPGDSLNNPIHYTCKLYSTPQAPCEYFNYSWGGTTTSYYDEELRLNVNAIPMSALVGQPISRNDGITATNFQMILAKLFSYAQKAHARFGVYGAFPFTNSLDGVPSFQTYVNIERTRLAQISTTCQPSTGGKLCPKIPVLDPVPIISRAALGGNFWDYLGLGFMANGTTAAGATTINVSSGGPTPCYAGDTIVDLTTPAAIAANATAISSTTTTVTVANTVVVGSGIQANDKLVCSMPGWNGGAVTYDNTHPWDPGVALLLPAAKIFMGQLLGVQQ
jgi:hypothetical protein